MILFSLLEIFHSARRKKKSPVIVRGHLSYPRYPRCRGRFIMFSITDTHWKKKNSLFIAFVKQQRAHKLSKQRQVNPHNTVLGSLATHTQRNNTVPARSNTVLDYKKTRSEVYSSSRVRVFLRLQVSLRANRTTPWRVRCPHSASVSRKGTQLHTKRFQVQGSKNTAF